MKQPLVTIASRVSVETHAWLQEVRDRQGISVSQAVSSLIEFAITHGVEVVHNKRETWVEAVLTRDGWECQDESCTKRDASPLVAHTLSRVDQLVLSNGKTLCLWCHKQAHGGDADLTGWEQVIGERDVMELWHALRRIRGLRRLSPTSGTAIEHLLRDFPDPSILEDEKYMRIPLRTSVNRSG